MDTSSNLLKLWEYASIFRNAATRDDRNEITLSGLALEHALSIFLRRKQAIKPDLDDLKRR